MKLALIGCGRLGFSILQGLSRAGFLDVSVFDVDKSKVDKAKSLGFKPCQSSREAVEQAEAVILSVKPAVVEQACQEIRDCCIDKLLISTAAATTLSKLKSLMPQSYVVRVMPNIAVSQNSSITLLAHPPDAPEEVLEKAVNIFKLLGEVLVVDEEDLERATVISGSGPAYIAYFTEALVKAAVSIGLNEQLALKLSTLTLSGASKLLAEAGMSTREVIDAVATPGGLTAKALETLDSLKLKEGFTQAVLEAYKKLLSIRQ
ncbi:MAG: pyrroline-5-carboxylate reductase [Candidatus Methanomethylicota archaeon]|uniref:Pyrroline-5-carboxylate reductase n=1 Tax=Thermoproteota archaeon TaxID=2056631 RepID=A0A497EP51_9CREN|nr:MAG: pyrroline-5-carboxylate reductase [Candidatus Verstraetearchaeota archaeon]